MSAYRSDESVLRGIAYSHAFFVIVLAIGWARSGESGWFMPKPEGWN